MNTDHPRSTTVTIRGLLRRLPTTVRGHVVAVLGELVGTISFLLFAFAGTQVAKISSSVNMGTMIVTMGLSEKPGRIPLPKPCVRVLHGGQCVGVLPH
ncbi:hypothetical protein ABVK25_001116 [Lepraria finkii]|uniref:Uncharacterized protein n=1 Tax=Lepraria finkii TaxID=1340010 RepID=A0ABR4BQH2_9LECA